MKLVLTTLSFNLLDSIHDKMSFTVGIDVCVSIGDSGI